MVIEQKCLLILMMSCSKIAYHSKVQLAINLPVVCEIKLNKNVFIGILTIGIVKMLDNNRILQE